MFSKILSHASHGSVGLVWSSSPSAGPRLIQILIPRPGQSVRQQIARRYPTARPRSCPEIDRLIADLKRFLDGQPVTFPLGLLDLKCCSPFQQRVLRAQQRVPRGRVTSYQQLAARAGNARAARAAGTALARNPFPLLIPCHRTVRSDRRPGDYQGGTGMKRSLLRAEGVAFDQRGRAVDRSHPPA